MIAPSEFLNQPFCYSSSFTAVAENAAWADWFTDYIPAGEETTEPPVDVFFPLIDSVDSIKPDTNAEVVGMISSSVYIRDIIRDILPPGSSGVILVVENECTPSFTYHVTHKAKYLGRGDFHDPKFDHLGVHARYDQLQEYAARGSKYSGPDVSTTTCQSTFHVYPSVELESEYVTMNPIYFTIGAVSIFCVCALIFIIYDCSVERRQKIVLNTAEKSNAVVASLFPAEVRDRLLQAQQEEKDKKKNSKDDAFRVKDLDGSGELTNNNFEGSPIAQLYPDTTVLFGDIAGFTAWSSSRQPSEVFHLLESVYNAFDKIAHDHRVFKVETIGDSYVAVCGLPKPRKNHAVTMARFAAECQEKAVQIFIDLESSLGPGTANLSFRFGLNSGTYSRCVAHVSSSHPR